MWFWARKCRRFKNDNKAQQTYKTERNKTNKTQRKQMNKKHPTSSYEFHGKSKLSVDEQHFHGDMHHIPQQIMMASSNGNIFLVSGPLCGNSPVTGGQWRGALMLSLICAIINSWVTNREAGELRRHHAHYGVTVMDYESLVSDI